MRWLQKKPLKCFIKHNELFYELYWIKHGNNQIIGNFYGRYFDSVLGFPVETHFNYPADGRVHYSLKSKEKECCIHAFYINIRIEHVIEGQRKLDYLSEKTVFNHLLPQPELQLPLSHYNKTGTFFHFATVGFSVPISDKAAILQHCKTQIEQPDKRDLVISTNSLEPGTLNIMGFLASPDYPQAALQAALNNTNYWQVVDKTKTPMIGISAIHNSCTP